MAKKIFTLRMLVLLLALGFIFISCDNDITYPDLGPRIGTITVTGLSSHIGNYLRVFILLPNGSAVGYSSGLSLTEISNPTVVIDFFGAENSTFNPNGTYDVGLYIIQTNDALGTLLASSSKTNITFINGFATITF